MKARNTARRNISDEIYLITDHSKRVIMFEKIPGGQLGHSTWKTRIAQLYTAGFKVKDQDGEYT